MDKNGRYFIAMSTATYTQAKTNNNNTRNNKNNIEKSSNNEEDNGIITKMAKSDPSNREDLVYLFLFSDLLIISVFIFI
jgi:hypothetical protein